MNDNFQPMDDEQKIDEDESNNNNNTTKSVLKVLYPTPSMYKPLSPSILGSPKIELTVYDKYSPSKGQIYDYNYFDVHKDLESNMFAGSYGWDNACYLAIAEARENVDLNEHFKHRTKVKLHTA